MSFEQPEKKFSIEEQFKNPEIVELKSNELEVFDIRPEFQKTEIPTFMVPGWLATPETLKENIMDLVRMNRRVISVNAPHGIKAEKSKQTENIPEAEFRKIMTLLGVIEEKEIEKTDLVAHSEGGFYATIAVSICPEKFRNLILVDPVGIIGEDNPRRLMVDFATDLYNQAKRGAKDIEVRKAAIKSSKEAIKSFLKNPIQSLKQVLAISNADIRLMLENIKKQGIGISVIHAVDDKAFPMERVQTIINTDCVDGFYSMKGTHNEIWLKHKECSGLIDQALSALENKAE